MMKQNHCIFCELRGTHVLMKGEKGSRYCPKCFGYEVDKHNMHLSLKERNDLQDINKEVKH